jgi:hypothetical protein
VGKKLLKYLIEHNGRAHKASFIILNFGYMKREDGYYWVLGYKWSDKPFWHVAHWMFNSWYYDGDDFDDDSMIEIDEKQIVREI